jgi:hypothetical protein
LPDIYISWVNVLASIQRAQQPPQFFLSSATIAFDCAFLESARGFMPTDVSEAGIQARKAARADFDGLRFMAKIGIEKGTGDYKDKNILLEVITPDRKEWHAIKQEPKHRTMPLSSASAATPITKPDWAK